MAITAGNSANGKKKLEFFWGYRTHAIIDRASGVTLVEKTFPACWTDAKVAKKLLKRLKRTYSIPKGIIVIGDKAYDEKEIYTWIIKQLKAKPIIALNSRNTNPDKQLSENGHRICAAGLEMYPPMVSGKKAIESG